ncbi:hypothetical protein F511_18785 [Dorcoceras hygrometricum]|uniref:Uncharacterized protein n=1 Tax=Dorcoceras hygrometricum TaxID=472368 RepID=A0A2Z7ADQ4_9LAMI|nr:hypothetical protein F511_18785 [Dorcoceras hygrometricum]
MSLFDLQDVCIAIGSIATLDLPMVVDLIGIYGLKGPYCTLTTTNWFLQALSVIPRGSWGDVARRFTMIRWAIDRTDLIGDRSYDEVAAMDIVIWTRARWVGPSPSLILFNIELRVDFNTLNTLNLTLNLALAAALPPLYKPPPPPRQKIVSGQFDEENPFMQISSVLLVQADEGVSFLVVDRIGDFYRNLPLLFNFLGTFVVGQFEESAGQNEDRRSASSRSRSRHDEEEEVGDFPPPMERMDVVIAQFKRMNPPVFNGDESSEDADSWLRNIVGLFDRVQYDDDLWLSLTTLLLRKATERWWRGASSTLLETGVGISWDSFCETFRQEYV